MMSKKTGRPIADTPIVRVHFIPELAEARGMNQSDLAHAVDVNPSTVSGWYQGSIPTPALQNRLAELFEIDVQSLFRHPADDEVIRSLSFLEAQQKIELAGILKQYDGYEKNTVIRVLRSFVAATS
ncbi:helix-turn-helix transcriptional regulator [Rhizobium sp. FKY42]|uniref:helix-turn-helix transcriptional regulator n=1 Tax=Rhizobium sp. FKY42 TaxID=2562310 RepID=UPI0010C0A22F|nr:helix-turn-helix transcriptional regulator [Rhizobium sp. FKY42]